MSKSLAIVLVAVAAGLVSASCATSANPTDDAGTNPSQNPNDAGSSSGDAFSNTAEGIEIAVSKMLPVTAADGMERIYVWLTARNVAAAAPIAVTSLQLSLVTTDALIVPADAESLTVKQACAGGGLLDTGGKLSCVAVFVAKAGTAKSIAYKLPSGASLRVPLSPRDCNALPQRGADVTEKQQATLPSITGPGDTTEVPNGDFVLTKAIVTDSSGSPPGAVTFRVSNGRYELVNSEAGEVTIRTTGTITTSDTALTLQNDCVWMAGRGRLDSVDESQPKSTSEHRYLPEKRSLAMTRPGRYSEYSLAD
ncbi:MAG: hypothetical protein KF819_21880 [Labilithrix sp.]|nr:hypothetical protein [Labilithrix sp.]